MYKCVLFDLDGTVADTDLLVIDGYLHLYKKYLPNEKPTLSQLASFSGPTLKDTISKYFSHCNMDELIEEFKTVTKPMYETYAKLYPGILDCLKECKELGIKTGIITSKLKSATSLTLKLLGIEKLIDIAIAFDEVSQPKPNPEGILKALNILNIRNCDTLFVGDALTDEHAAKNANVDCCMVTWNLRGRLEGSNSKYTVNTTKELMEVIVNYE
ncbi:MAG: HAD family hydrolase [Bacilli bacterium]|nr:HAD family hydrolase [Bacilli bacterium]